ncbi:MAG: FKBP-type peptidyl-prolyl cis-trans isomerase [Flavobacteriaceae bacterium]
MKNFSLFILSSLLLVSCYGPEVDYSEANDQEIQDYLEANDLEATKTESGLYYHIDQQGEGPNATLTSTVKVTYLEYGTDGTIYTDQTKGPVILDLEFFPIEGFSEGLSYFNKGSSGTLYIPAALAYGDRNVGNIPKGAVLIYDVDLIDIL